MHFLRGRQRGAARTRRGGGPRRVGYRGWFAATVFSTPPAPKRKKRRGRATGYQQLVVRPPRLTSSSAPPPFSNCSRFRKRAHLQSNARVRIVCARASIETPPACRYLKEAPRCWYIHKTTPTRRAFSQCVRGQWMRISARTRLGEKNVGGTHSTLAATSSSSSVVVNVFQLPTALVRRAHSGTL